MAELIATGSSATSSSDFTLTGGQKLTLFLKSSASGGNALPQCQCVLQVKSADGYYYDVARFSDQVPLLEWETPGTYRVQRKALASGSVGVDANVTAMAYVSATTITRPNDTAVYASGDLVANSTTAGSVVPGQMVLPSNAFCIPKLRLRKSGTGVTNAAFSVHLFKATVGVSNGDNGVFTPSAMANWLGSVDITSMRAFADGAVGNGVPTVGPAISDELAFGSNTLYYLIEAKGAYTPTAQEVFTVILELY